MDASSPMVPVEMEQETAITASPPATAAPAASEETKAPVVTFKSWHGVASWSFDIENDACAICHNNLMCTCITCEAEPQHADECSAAFGECGHSYHLHCLSADTPVSLHDAGSRLIRDLRVGDRVRSFAERDGKQQLVTREVTHVLNQGEKPCLELTLYDGRKLVCTEDHRILTIVANGSMEWVQAGQLSPDAVLCMGTQPPLYLLEEDAVNCAQWSLDCTETLGYTLDMKARREHSLAFFRILGYLLTDGTVTSTSCKINLGHAIDVASITADFHLLTAKHVGAPMNRNTYQVYLPGSLAKAYISIGVDIGKRVSEARHFPKVVLFDGTESKFPLPLVRAFLSGLFGGDGKTFMLGDKKAGGQLNGLGFIKSAKASCAEQQRKIIQTELGALLARVGITQEMCDWTSRHGPTGVTQAGRDAIREKKRKGEQLSKKVDFATVGEEESIRIDLQINTSGYEIFCEKIGFAYCCHKQTRADVALMVQRTRNLIGRQREEIREAVRTSARLHPKPMEWARRFGDAAESVAQKYGGQLHPVNEAWKPVDKQKALWGNGLRTRIDCISVNRLLELYCGAEGASTIFGEKSTKPKYNATKRLKSVDGSYQHLFRQAEDLDSCVGDTMDELLDAVEVELADNPEEFSKVTYGVPRDWAGLRMFKMPLVSSRLLLNDDGSPKLLPTFDISVQDIPQGDAAPDDVSDREASFVANGVVVHNCISKWMKTRTSCPLCDAEWAFASY